MWYQSWQSGYNDILKRGFPRPSDDQTILAELRSPKIPDFLLGGDGAVPFLVSDRAREAIERSRLSGFDFGTVIVAKIATKGRRQREVATREPEDPILKSRGVSLDLAPTLHAVRVTGLADVFPDYDSGKTPAGWVSPFRLKPEAIAFDLWRPSHAGKAFSAWTFCSDRFRLACESLGSGDIEFEPFGSFMERFRESLKGDGRG
jgi:hypothetical protein